MSKLILCLTLVLSGGFISSRADETNAIASKPPEPYRSFMRILDENGEKLGCSFTVEYRGYAVTGKESKADPFYTQYTKVRADLDADSIPSLMSKLHDYLDGFRVVPDAKNPKIIHIIENVLADDKNYALNKKISVNYSGLLGGTNVPVMPINGYATLVGGLLPAVAEKAGDIRGGSETSGASGGAGGSPWDSVTQINVNATNETVRSIFTDCLPTANYNPVMWVAVASKRNGEQNVLVHFFGPIVGVTTLAAAVTKVKLKFVKVDSEETNGQDGFGKNTVDGNPNTSWHTQWQSNSLPLPHEIIIELIPPSIVKGFTYLPRQDESDHGTIKIALKEFRPNDSLDQNRRKQFCQRGDSRLYLI